MSPPDEARHDVGQLGHAIELMPDGVVVFDTAGCIVLVNQRLLEATGYARQDLVAQQVITLMPAELRDSLSERLAGYLGSPVARQLGEGLMMKMARKDGTTFEVEVANSPIHTTDGPMIFVIVRHVSDLSLEDLGFRALLESSSDPTLILDRDGRILLCNTQVEKLLGHAHVTVFDKPIDVLFPERDAPRVRGLLMEHQTARDVRVAGVGFGLRALRPDGSEVPVELAMAPVQTTRGMLTRAAIHDLTDLQELQQETDRLKDEFLATVSHELRTPLTSVLGYAELLEELGGAELGDTARSFVAVIRRSADRELRLVDDLLTMVQIDGDGLSLNQSTVDLRRLVLQAVEAAAPLARSREVGLSFVSDGRVAHVFGDPDRLGQALDNLISNAMKFSPEDGEVIVRLSADDETVTVQVEDSGPGIARHEVPRVFDRLYRGSQAVSDEVPGAGLGLSIVKAILDAHDGRVTVHTSPGEGARFLMQIPRVSPPADEELDEGAVV